MLLNSYISHGGGTPVADSGTFEIQADNDFGFVNGYQQGGVGTLVNNSVAGYDIQASYYNPDELQFYLFLSLSGGVDPGRFPFGELQWTDNAANPQSLEFLLAQTAFGGGTRSFRWPSPDGINGFTIGVNYILTLTDAHPTFIVSAGLGFDFRGYEEFGAGFVTPSSVTIGGSSHDIKAMWSTNASNEVVLKLTQASSAAHLFDHISFIDNSSNRQDLLWSDATYSFSSGVGTWTWPVSGLLFDNGEDYNVQVTEV